MKLSLKHKTLISVALFVVIFAGLLVAATFTDLEVSHILTETTSLSQTSGSIPRPEDSRDVLPEDWPDFRTWNPHT